MFSYAYIQFQILIQEEQSSKQSVTKQQRLFQSSNDPSISSISNVSDHSEITSQQLACLTGKIMLMILVNCQSNIILKFRFYNIAS